MYIEELKNALIRSKATNWYFTAWMKTSKNLDVFKDCYYEMKQKKLETQNIFAWWYHTKPCKNHQKRINVHKDSLFSKFTKITCYRFRRHWLNLQIATGKILQFLSM